MHRGRGLCSWRIVDSRCEKYSAGVGYLSQSDGRVLFGLGAAEEVERVESPLAQWSGAGIGATGDSALLGGAGGGRGASLLVMSGQRIQKTWSHAQQPVQIDSRLTVPRYAARGRPDGRRPL